jgi:hypothetical protein
MARHAQRVERPVVVASCEPVDGAPGARLPEAIAEEVRRHPVVLVGELAELLGTSTRTIQRQLRAGTFFIAPLPQIDYHLRWSRERVYRAIADTTFESHRRSLLGPRDVRKPGSAAK